jgi:hypothetical protein
MKIRFHIALLLLGVVMLSVIPSCTPGDKAGKPRSSGSASELLVVTDTKDDWNGPIGDTIRAWFSQPMIVLPQREAMFDMINVGAADFGDLFQKFHVIFIVDLDSSLTLASSETLTDPWSAPQRVIRVKAPDKESFFAEFNRNKESYLRLFNQLEKDRIRKLNQMTGDLDISRKISAKFDLSIDLPAGFYIASDGADFMWLRHMEVKGTQDIELGIMIYFTEYRDTAQLSQNYILKWRNIITRQHIPGPSDGSYMKVADEFVRPVVKIMQDFPAGYALETRGLWDVEGDFMGGAFLSYTFVDQKRNRLVTLDGYIYNPNELKRNFLRQLEAIFYTISITE